MNEVGFNHPHGTDEDAEHAEEGPESSRGLSPDQKAWVAELYADGYATTKAMDKKMIALQKGAAPTPDIAVERKPQPRSGSVDRGRGGRGRWRRRHCCPQTEHVFHAR
jgi:hypothetical protein